MPKISVVMPIYNSEEYLEMSLYSVLTQELIDLEVILVDDGSTDSSGEICDKYAQIDNRIKVIHNKNSGMGVSYNTGIDVATGEYIGFVESDDKVDKHMYRDLYRLAEQHNKPDIIKSSWFTWLSSTGTISKDTQLINYNDYDLIDIKLHSDLLCVQFSVWSAIYRTDFIKGNNIRYLETPGASYQDVDFTYKAFCLSKNMVISPNAYYYYRVDNENSSINSKEKSEVIFDEYKEVDRFFSEHPEIKQWANTSKLVRQYVDYKWNYGRIANKFKPTFLKHFARDFKKYNDIGELDRDPNFYINVDRNVLSTILNML